MQKLLVCTPAVNAPPGSRRGETARPDNNACEENPMRPNLAAWKCFGDQRRVRRALALSVFVAAFVYFAWPLPQYEPELNELQDVGIAHDLFTYWNLPVDQSPIYYVILNVFEHLNHSWYPFLRLPSIAFGALAAVFVFFVAEAEAGAVAGLLAALLLTLNPLSAYYARMARTYSLLIALGAACLWYAHVFLTRGRRHRDFVALLICTVLGVYAHLFFLLFAGSIALLLLGDFAAHRRDYPELKRLLHAAAVAFAVLLVQLVRIVYVLEFTQARQTMYAALEHKPLSFLRAVGVEFFSGFLGKNPYAAPIAAATAALIVGGMLALRRRGLVAGLALILPSLAATYHLAARNPVSPRYVIFLLPVFAVFMAAALVKMRTVWLWGPLTVAIALQGLAGDWRQANPPSDWNDAVRYVSRVQQPDDVIAVFPPLWAPAFARYFPQKKFTPFISAEELDRALATGRRVILVEYPGRYFGHIAAYMRKHARTVDHFETKLRYRLSVFVLEAPPLPPVEIADRENPSLLLGGIVNSGSYPWAAAPNGESPLARVDDIFQSADLVVTSYEPYRVSWRDGIAELFAPPKAPFTEAAAPLAAAGVKAVAMLPPRGLTADFADRLRGAGVLPIALAKNLNGVEPTMLAARDQKIAFFSVGQRVFTDRPALRPPGDPSLADWERAVSQARRKAGPGARLVIFLPQARDDNRLFARDDQLLARRAIDLGADVVVGQGGRAVKEIEEYKNGVIAYSLGALLQSATRADAERTASGALLRLTFPPGEKPRWQLFPVTLDTDFRVARTRADKTDDLVLRRPDDPAAEHLDARLLDAKVEMEDGAKAEVSEFSVGPPPKKSRLPETWQKRIDDFRGWYYDAPSADEYPQEGYFRGRSYVAVDGMTSMGDFRRAMRFKPATAAKIRATFPNVRFGERLGLHFAFVDDDVDDRHLPYPPEWLIVTAGDVVLFRQKVEFVIGWKNAIVDTGAFAGREADLTIAIEETKPGTSFSLAIDAVVLRSADAVAALAERPYRFAEHLREARPTVAAPNAPPRRCVGPDETFRYLRAGPGRFEEHGPFGEGIFYERWICGADVWDGPALTRQRSRGILHDAIWFHPAKNARRTLTFGPVRLGSEIKGYYGLTDLAVRLMPKGAPTNFVVLVDGREIYREAVPANRRGWRDFAVAIPEDLRGQDKEISFVSDAANAAWRHLCVDAWME